MTTRMVPDEHKHPSSDPPVYKPALVEVKWLDAYADTGWKPVGRYTEGEIKPSYTTGYLLRDNEKDIRLVQTITPHDGVATEGMTIPKGMVLSVRVIETFEELPDPEEQDESQAAPSEGREPRS